MARVLVVDDDRTVSEVVAGYLRRAGHDVAVVHDGTTGLARVLQAEPGQEPELVVLDVMLPGLDGIEVCRRLRRDHDVPVVMLTALGAEVDRVLGLEVGADDYVTKPFSNRELVLRVASVLRRREGGPGAGGTTAGPREGQVLSSADLVLDPAARTVTRAGRALALTGREFDLLAHLLRHPGRAYSREELLAQVWGWDFGDHSTVTVHARRLRHKTEADPAEPVLLVTVWGVGYRWDAPVVVQGPAP